MRASFQLRSAHYLYALTLTASAVCLFGWPGFFVAVLVCGVWAQILSGAVREQIKSKSLTDRSSRAGSLRLEFLAVGSIVAVMLIALMPAHSDFDAMQQSQASLRQIAKAVATYEVKHGCRLPTVIKDAEGRPMHSWRALVLSDIGEQRLESVYRFDEPWNSANNQLLHSCRPWHLQPFYLDVLHSELPQPQELTNVHLVHHPSGGWCVVEHEGVPINWAEPNELTWDELLELNQPPETNEGFWHFGVFRSRYRGRVIASSKQVATLHPGEEFSIAEIDQSSELGHVHFQYHFYRLVRIVVFSVLMLYPIRWLRGLENVPA
ncbi:MAG TPA: hypothetical protein DDW52_20790 [Planctomycetaceae bacterium]|nr:hypothetical protein [Planctomycetaceae bacterium]